MPRYVANVLLIVGALGVSAAVGFRQGGTSTGGHLDRTKAEQGLAIVVNKSNPATDLSFPELHRIFLGERSHWPNGRRITLVMIEAGRPEREAILRELYHMSETDLNHHFLHALFTGQMLVSPKTLNTPVGVCKFVFNVPGAIGYVRASDVDDSVRVVRIDGHLPEDREYDLRIPATVKTNE
jgi:ABC-type phosphate transport system substrate-binding protein